MGLAYNTYLNSNRVYGCKGCKTHLANHDDIVSRNFRGQHGKAYLFNSVVNIETGEPSERNMTTGRHVVRDITCRVCSEVVGWKYDKAYEASEKYKEGKFILEAELLCTVSWEGPEEPAAPMATRPVREVPEPEPEVSEQPVVSVVPVVPIPPRPVPTRPVWAEDDGEENADPAGVQRDSGRRAGGR